MEKKLSETLNLKLKTDTFRLKKEEPEVKIEPEVEKNEEKLMTQPSALNDFVLRNFSATIQFIFAILFFAIGDVIEFELWNRTGTGTTLGQICLILAAVDFGFGTGIDLTKNDD